MLTVRDLQTSKYELLEAALDVLAAGVVLTTRDGQVVYMNSAARQQVRTSPLIYGASYWPPSSLQSRSGKP